MAPGWCSLGRVTVSVLLLGGASSLRRAPRSAGNSSQGDCIDYPPGPPYYECAEQEAWGKCGDSWMVGYCCKTCHGCGGPGCGADSNPMPVSMVVTLGDSYSSGTGIHNKGSEYDEEHGGYVAPWKLTVRSDDECWREKDTTPGPMYAIANQMPSVFLACKGAEVIHVENQMSYLNTLYPKEASNKWQGSVILLTAGGNDLRTNRGEDWPELLERCILELNPFVSCDEREENQIANFATVQSRLTNLFTKLAAEATMAKIRILGYPRVMQRDPGCSSVTGVGSDEADWMDDQVDILNQRIQSAVNAAKAQYPQADIQFVSVLPYITIGACGPSSTRQVNDKVLDGISTSDASFHPTQFGYDRYFVALSNSLR